MSSELENKTSIESIEIGTEILNEPQTEAEDFRLGPLSELISTTHIFVKKTDDQRLDGENGYTRFYDVIDSFGMRIFQCVDRTPKGLRKEKSQTDFTIVLLDFQGEVLLEFEGEVGKGYEAREFKASNDGSSWGGVTHSIYYDNRDIYAVEFWKEHDPLSMLPETDIVVDGPPKPAPKRGLKSLLKRKNKNTPAEASKSLRKVEAKMKKKTVVFAERIVQPKEILYIVGDKYSNNIGCCGLCGNMVIPEERLHRLRLDIEASVFLPDRTTKVGRVGKNWVTSDSIKCDPNDIFNIIGIQIPRRTDVRIKAILIGALFLMDPALFCSSD